MSLQEREMLFDVARSFDSVPHAVDITRRPAVRHPIYTIDEDSPFLDFNNRGDPVLILTKHGWKIVKERSDRIYFRRPGKIDGYSSGDFHYGLRLFGVFTPNTIFKPHKGYSPSAIYSFLECGGDFKHAAKRLIDLGYGKSYRARGPTKWSASM